ncbi:MAG: sulfatase [bacterium]|nr:sulfatase [bacterium]
MIDRPNVIIISIDALRRDHISVYSERYIETPNIDDFASESIVYTNAYTNSPWTMPSLYTMLSSKYPSVHDVREFKPGNRRIKMLAQILAENGYDTEAIVSNPLVRDDFGFDKGFYRYNRFNETIPFGAFKVVSLCNSISAIAVYFDRPGCEGDATPWVTGMLTSKLAKNRKRPFFIWAHYMDPHWPYFPPDEFVNDPTSYLSGLPEGELEAMLSTDRRLPKSKKALSLYYEAETRYVDAALREVFDIFGEKGYYEDTLIILTADHGEEIFEHGKFGHAITHYKEVIDIPLIIYIPGNGGGTTETPVALIDVTPTILNYVGIETRDELMGFDILNGFSEDTERDIFLDGILGDSSIISLRRGGYTLTRYGGSEYEYRLIDNRVGILKDDVTDKYPEIVDSYKAVLDQWYIETSEEADEFADRKMYKEDKAQEDNLKDLGYLN